MNTEALLRRLDDIDVKRRALLDEVALLDPGVLAARPADDGWSVLEILEHLVLAERDVVGDLAGAVHRAGQRRTLKNRALHAVVHLVLRVGIPVRAPSRRMVPSGNLSLDEIRHLWDETGAALRAHVAGLDAEAAGRAVFRHPVSGPLTVGQAVRLMDVHLDRHVGQIRRVLAALE